MANLGKSLEVAEGLASAFPNIVRAGPIALKFRVVTFFMVKTTQNELFCIYYQY